MEVALDGSDAGIASVSAAVGFLSAPPGDPVADSLPGGTADGAGGAEDPGGLNGAAVIAGMAGLNPVPGPGNGNGNGSSGNVSSANGSSASGGPADRSSANGGSANGSSGNVSENLRAGGEPADQAERPTDVTQALVAPPRPAEAVHAQAPATWDASEVVTEIYTLHYNQLVRLAVMLVHDVQTAEEVVQDSFEAMHMAWRRLRNTEKALSYLRQAIVNKSRSVLRHRKVVEMHPPKPAPDEQSAEHAALTLIERSAVTSALRSLPVRQREAVVLRYYGDFSEADIAKAMGISRGAVKSHTARAMASLKSILERET
jgi:RNA polymerase sigma-70 factor (sigma-E family)